MRMLCKVLPIFLALATFSHAATGPRGKYLKADQVLLDTNYTFQVVTSNDAEHAIEQLDASLYTANTNITALKAEIDGTIVKDTDSNTYSNGTTQSLYDLVVRNDATVQGDLVVNGDATISGTLISSSVITNIEASGFAAYSSNSTPLQAVSEATTTRLTGFNTEGFDTYGAFATNVYTPTEPGWYSFAASVVTSNNIADAVDVHTWIAKNGDSGYAISWTTNAVPLGADTDTGSDIMGYVTHSGSGLMYADGVDDYFDVRVRFEDAAAGGTLYAGPVRFSAEFLGAAVNMDSVEDFLFTANRFAGLPQLTLTTNMLSQVNSGGITDWDLNTFTNAFDGDTNTTTSGQIYTVADAGILTIDLGQQYRGWVVVFAEGDISNAGDSLSMNMHYANRDATYAAVFSFEPSMAGSPVFSHGLRWTTGTRSQGVFMLPFTGRFLGIETQTDGATAGTLYIDEITVYATEGSLP